MRILAAFAVASLCAWPVQAQPADEPAPRTPWGHPDLQGRWTNATITLLERPVEFGSKEFFTESEAVEYARTGHERFLESAGLREEAALSGEFEPGLWLADRPVVATRRTSLIVGPTGRLPPRAGAAPNAGGSASRELRADDPEQRNLQERCLFFPVGGPPLLPGAGFNSNYQIVQTPTHVAILTEMGSSVRIVALDGRPTLPPALRQWSGDSRGRWENDTLVVETTGLRVPVRGGSPRLRLIERFRPAGDSAIVYEFTVVDPDTWTEPWTAEVPLRRLDGELYEFACHEGNRGLENILKGARFEERQK
jgi:hypothetical protein